MGNTAGPTGCAAPRIHTHAWSNGKAQSDCNAPGAQMPLHGIVPLRDGRVQRNAWRVFTCHTCQATHGRHHHPPAHYGTTSPHKETLKTKFPISGCLCMPLLRTHQPGKYLLGHFSSDATHSRSDRRIANCVRQVHHSRCALRPHKLPEPSGRNAVYLSPGPPQRLATRRSLPQSLCHWHCPPAGASSLRGGPRVGCAWRPSVLCTVLPAPGGSGP